MKTIEIAAVPNQSFSVRLDDDLYSITIKAAAGIMAVSIARNNVPIITGARMTAGQPLIPYKYQEKGNFTLLTESDQLPDYTQFGNTQTLIYATVAEVEAFRAGT